MNNDPSGDNVTVSLGDDERSYRESRFAEVERARKSRFDEWWSLVAEPELRNTLGFPR